MKSYKIGRDNRIVTLNPTRAFFGPNSLLSIKITRMSIQAANQPIVFQITYANAQGYKWGFPMHFDPPFYFNAITPNLNELQQSVPPPLFTWIEIKTTDINDYVIEVSFNTNLDRNLDPFRKSILPE